MTKLVMVLGCNGQVAREIASLLARTGRRAVFAGREVRDLVENPEIDDLIERAGPVGVINAAAYSAVDAAEHDSAAAWTLNAIVPEKMAKACTARGLPFVHFSTDYVFDGAKRAPYLETDCVSPINVYGASKAAGDAAIQGMGGRWSILRTSWLFSASGNNFVKTMLRLAERTDRIRVVADQFGTPTHAADCAKAAIDVLDRLTEGDTSASGLLNLAGPQSATWADLAEHTMSEARKYGLPYAQIDRIPTTEYPTASRRPIDTRLDCTLAVKRLSWGPRPWREGVSETVASLQSA